ncbi:MAG: hypothetical protein Q9191_007256 [Dirinaria sp. TL-2023a]
MAQVSRSNSPLPPYSSIEKHPHPQIPKSDLNYGTSLVVGHDATTTSTTDDSSPLTLYMLNDEQQQDNKERLKITESDLSTTRYETKHHFWRARTCIFRPDHTKLAIINSTHFKHGWMRFNIDLVPYSLSRTDRHETQPRFRFESAVEGTGNLEWRSQGEDGWDLVCTVQKTGQRIAVIRDGVRLQDRETGSLIGRGTIEIVRHLSVWLVDEVVVSGLAMAEYMTWNRQYGFSF